ncbi:hypothetical protein EPUL_005317, partial [Erysiphe pulchra]
TLFVDPTNETDASLENFGQIKKVRNKEPEWVWKDGKGGYAALIEQIYKFHQAKITDTIKLGWSDSSNSYFMGIESNIADFSIPSTQLDSIEQHLCRVSCNAVDLAPINKALQSSNWFGHIYELHRTNVIPPNLHRLKRRIFLNLARRHRIIDNNLFIEIRGIWKRCVSELEVGAVLFAAHDEAGHHAARLTSGKLRYYYWPRISKDTHDYILGCLYCAKHGTARLTQSQSPPSVAEKMALLIMDFIGPLPQAKLSVEDSIKCCFPQFSEYTGGSNEYTENGFSGSTFTHKFVVIDYFSRFLFEIWGPPVAVYSDIGSLFSEAIMQKFLSQQGVLWLPAPSGSKRSTGMVEKTNDLIERILKKSLIAKSGHSVFKEIRSLGFSPYEIMFGYQPSSSLEIKMPILRRSQLHFLLYNADLNALDDDKHASSSKRDTVIQKDSLRRKFQKDRHDLGISRVISYNPGDLVMLYDHSAAKRKLCPLYRGPFVVSGSGGDHENSYVLRQVNGDSINNTFHGDQLKPFRLRELMIEVYQNIRLGRGRHKLPIVTGFIPGTHATTNTVDVTTYFLFSEYS